MPSYKHPIYRRDTNTKHLFRGMRFWLRYWRHFHQEERIDRNPIRFAWSHAWRNDSRNRANDRVKYS